MDKFVKEIQDTSTGDLLTILKDQRDLYTEAERAEIKKELSSRTGDPVLLNALKQQKEKQKEIEAQEHEKQQILVKEQLQNHMLTTGYNFEGYEIHKYVGIVSEEVVIGTGVFSELSASLSDFLGDSSGAFSKKLKQAKNSALKKLVSTSITKGGNAIIGIDFDYITFSNNMIGVVVNGTSVIVEKSTM